MSVDPRLVNVAFENLPAIVGLIKGAFKQHAPDAPDPTDAEVIAAYHTALSQSLEVDDAWLRAHPKG